MASTDPQADAAALKSKALDEDPAAAKVHRIRITLTSRNVKNLEKGAQPPRHAHRASWAPFFPP